MAYPFNPSTQHAKGRQIFLHFEASLVFLGIEAILRYTVRPYLKILVVCV